MAAFKNKKGERNKEDDAKKISYIINIINYLYQHERDYERLSFFTIEKRFLHYISGHTFPFPITGLQSLVFMIYWPHLNSLVKSPTFRKIFRKSSAFTAALLISRCVIIFYIRTQHIFIQNIHLKASEQVETRKFLEIRYWQDTISGVAINNNVKNINKLWEVSTSFVICTIFHLTLFFDS